MMKNNDFDRESRDAHQVATLIVLNLKKKLFTNDLQ